MLNLHCEHLLWVTKIFHRSVQTHVQMTMKALRVLILGLQINIGQ